MWNIINRIQAAAKSASQHPTTIITTSVMIGLSTTSCLTWDQLKPTRLTTTKSYDHTTNHVTHVTHVTHVKLIDHNILSEAIDKGGALFTTMISQLETIAASPTAESTPFDEFDELITSLIITNTTNWQLSQLERALALYHFSAKSYPWVVFSHILKSPLPEAPALAWRSLLSVKVTAHHRTMADHVLSNALESGQLDKHLVTEMAELITKWQLVTVYDIAKLGLMSRGDGQYAQAMATLKPEQATLDFMNYLALVPNTDLRQLTLAAITDITANTILTHLQHFPPDLGHIHFDKLFVFAASRQLNLKNLATHIIDKMVPSNPAVMAYRLSKQPQWVQYSIIEEAHRAMTGNRQMLLSQLAKITADPNIVQEIAAVQAGDVATHISVEVLETNPSPAADNTSTSP